jgi:rRNA maturation RNase YbeY
MKEGRALSALNLEFDIILETKLPNDGHPDLLPALVRFVLEEEGASGDWSVVLLLTSDDALRTLHRDYMGIDTETDVMTFPFGEEPGGLGYGGEIAISVDRAKEQASEFGLTKWEEIRFLAVHGILHLLGWDDGTDEQRGAMLDRQRELLTAFDHGEAAK